MTGRGFPEFLEPPMHQFLAFTGWDKPSLPVTPHLCLSFVGPPQRTTPVARAPIRSRLRQNARAAHPESTIPTRRSRSALHAPAASTKTWKLRKAAIRARG
jgi:hypothetical protein